MRHQFIMPKSKVDYYDGSDVYLKIPSQLLSLLNLEEQQYKDEIVSLTERPWLYHL